MIQPAEPAPAVQPVPPRFWWLKRLSLAGLALLAALGVARWGWGLEAQRRLNHAIEEYRARGEPILLEDFQRPPPPDELNAAIPLRRAFAALASNSRAWAGASLPDLYFDPEFDFDNLEYIGLLLEELEGALCEERAARHRPLVDWQIKLTRPVYDVRIPEYLQIRALAKCAEVAATYHHARLNDAEAVELLRDVLDLGQRCGAPGPSVIGHLVSIAVQALACQGIQATVPALRVAGLSPSEPGDPPAASRAQVQALIAELLDERFVRESWLRAARGERMSLLDNARLWWGGREPSSALIPPRGPAPQSPPSRAARASRPLCGQADDPARRVACHGLANRLDERRPCAHLAHGGALAAETSRDARCPRLRRAPDDFALPFFA